MTSRALDDFIDDCFLEADDICNFQIYRTRKYEKRVNAIASEFIATRNENPYEELS
tara:strand:+ start:366 stop:533 length:168 start_codon:yes stop_codon:yes gene_type:complete